MPDLDRFDIVLSLIFDLMDRLLNCNYPCESYSDKYSLLVLFIILYKPVRVCE